MSYVSFALAYLCNKYWSSAESLGTSLIPESYQAIQGYIDPPKSVLSTYSYVPNYAPQSILLPLTDRMFPAAS